MSRKRAAKKPKAPDVDIKIEDHYMDAEEGRATVAFLIDGVFDERTFGRPSPTQRWRPGWWDGSRFEAYEPDHIDPLIVDFLEDNEPEPELTENPSAASDSEVLVVDTPLADMLEASGIRVQTPNRAQFADEELLACFVRVGLVRAPKWKPTSRGPKLEDRHAVALLLRHLADYDREHLVVVAVDAARRLLGVAEVHIGNVSQSLLDPRDMLRVPLLLGAAGFWMAHNHPSGDPTSSREDRVATKGLSGSAECAGLEFLGSLVIAHDGYTDVETLAYNSWPKS